jgi:O-antigen/teichoic acid export membrane protein
MQRLFRQLTPFIFIGIAIVAFAFSVMILAYLFLFGAMIGLLLFVIVWIKDKFLTTKPKTPSVKRSGRIIDSDDWKKMG